MEHYLDCFIRFVTALRSTNSRLDKEDILRNFWQESLRYGWELDKLFHYVYDYDKQYYITSANILKKDLTEKGLLLNKTYNVLWDLLDDLSNRVITGHNAIMAVQQFLKYETKDRQELILNIIDKDLKCGLSEVTINKVCGNIIKTYDVALASKFDPKKHHLDANWVIERKLDGVRCNVINKDGVIKCYSRQGKEITTLQKLIDELQGILPNNTVFDGEICIIDKDGNEDFQSIMKVIKRKDYTIENPMLKVFDCIQLEDFENKKSHESYFQRVNRLKSILDCHNLKTVSIVNYETYSPEALERWNKMVKDYNWEGLMFRKNVEYEGKRTQNLLKYKMFQDAEYKIIDVEEGDAQELIDGIMKKIKCAGALIIEHKGNRVGVGTGLSLEQRKKWYAHPEDIIGKVCTIKFFEETVDQNGKPSLRFPVLKTVFDGERDV